MCKGKKKQRIISWYLRNELWNNWQETDKQNKTRHVTKCNASMATKWIIMTDQLKKINKYHPWKQVLSLEHDKAFTINRLRVQVSEYYPQKPPKSSIPFIYVGKKQLPSRFFLGDDLKSRSSSKFWSMGIRYLNTAYRNLVLSTGMLISK